MRCFALLGAFTLVAAGAAQTRFAIIGDYGANTVAEGQVSNLVHSWNPEFILTTGDNNYESGLLSTIDTNIGKYYHDTISPYIGNFGAGAVTNKFWPCAGNHDWGNIANNPTGLNPYLAYFTLPGNERYYDQAVGPVRFFMLDSDGNEPDGNTSTSIQANWLQNRLLLTSEPWKLVFMHHPPYSSSQHGSSTYMRWPFGTWGADFIFAGHDHTYERIFRDNRTYIVNGLGGKSIYTFGTIVNGSQFRFNGDYGAQYCEAWNTAIRFSFITIQNQIIETVEQGTPPPSIGDLTISASVRSPQLNWSAVAFDDPVIYQIQRSPRLAGPFRTIGETTQTTFTDGSAVRSGPALFYRVNVLGPIRTSSPPSNTVATRN